MEWMRRQRVNGVAGCLLFLAMVAVPVGAGAQAGFEGAVSMTMQIKGQSFPVDYSLKGHKARVEMQTTGRKNVILLDLDARTQTILIPEMKAYAVHTGAGPSAMSTAAPPKITALGTTETVAGHSCDDYRIESEKYSGTACLTKDFGDNPLAEAMSSPMGNAFNADETLKKAGMPLKMNLTFKDGDQQGDTATVEVTKIAAGPIDDARFSVPDGWHKLSGLPGLQ
jgi:hypothetical protein